MDGIKIRNYNDIFNKYDLALQTLSDKINLIIRELENSMGDTPVEHVKGRIKSLDSIKEKLEGDGHLFNVYNMENFINDIVGVRIVCCFRNDLNKIINLINNDPDIRLIDTKDYIGNPKNNGYFSYHMIVEVPVVDHTNNKVDYVRAEIQIRTLAMDLWASLEHKTSYKKDVQLSLENQKKIDSAALVTYQMDKELENIIDKLNHGDNEFNGMESSAIDFGIEDVINDEVMYKYKIALKKLMVEIDSMYDMFKFKQEDNPIEHIKWRLKSPMSIYRKLSMMGYEVNEEVIANAISDVVGVRIVCSFLSDLDKVISTIFARIEAIPEMEIVKVKDYITNPKENGYSSYHIIVRIPVYVNGVLEFVNSEIQIRTKAMNMWASLEHKLCYKKESTDEVKNTLKEYAMKISKIDHDFNNIITEVKLDSCDYALDKPKKRIKKLV